MYPSPSPSSSPEPEFTVYWKTESILAKRNVGRRSVPAPPVASTSTLVAPSTPTSKRTTTTAKLASPSSVVPTSTGCRSQRRAKKRRADVVPGASQEKVDEETMRTLGAIARRMSRKEASAASLAGTTKNQTDGTLSAKEGVLRDSTRLSSNGKIATPVAPSVKGKEKEKTMLVTRSSVPQLPTPQSVKSTLPTSHPTSKSSLSLTTASKISQPSRPPPKAATPPVKTIEGSSLEDGEDEYDSYYPDEGESFELALSQIEEKLSSSQAAAKSVSKGMKTLAQPTSSGHSRCKSKEEKDALVRKELEALKEIDVESWSDEDF